MVRIIVGETDWLWCCRRWKRSRELRRWVGVARAWALQHRSPPGRELLAYKVEWRGAKLQQAITSPPSTTPGPTGSRLPASSLRGGAATHGCEVTQGSKQQSRVRKVPERIIMVWTSQHALPTCNPPCRSVLTVVLTSEARLYRYLTCGGQSSKSFRQEVSSKEERFASKKLPSIEAQGRLDVWTEALGHIVTQKVNPVKLPTILFSQNIFVSFIHYCMTSNNIPLAELCQALCRQICQRYFCVMNILSSEGCLIVQGSKCRTHSSLRARAFLPTSTTTRCKIFRNEESCVKAYPGKMRCMKETVWIPGARCNRKVPNYGWIQNRHSLSNSRWQGLTLNVGDISFTE